ncbi:MAG: PQQ-dependent sugar dehydrogenase [Gammaproteobacteria bacterium]|nr:PQQ-dependent sugar dehydrogenase [Gammaproteobacteria bacterium]
MARIKIAAITLLLLFCSGILFADESDGFSITTIVEGLDHPWSIAFLPNGQMLVTERPGQLRLVENGKLHPHPIAGLPAITEEGQGGLLDVALHPDYKDNGWIYLSFSAAGDGGLGVEVIRGRLSKMRLVDIEPIFRVARKSSGGRHFGSRLLFDRNGHLYISAGERGDRLRAQDLSDHAGSIIRLHDDGSIPSDNPFIDRSDAKPEIYSYGHRNPQGMALHPQTGEVWSHEHGPQGGDEINIIKSGNNYGWPVITYGVNYGWGTQVGEGSHKTGMEQPLHYWDPSIAPSGMAFYSGDKFPQWRGNLFVGALKFRLLVRMELDGNSVVKEHRILKGQLGRIRDVRDGPDGYIYLLTDESNGKLVRLEPKR